MMRCRDANTTSNIDRFINWIYILPRINRDSRSVDPTEYIFSDGPSGNSSGATNDGYAQYPPLANLGEQMPGFKVASGRD